MAFHIEIEDANLFKQAVCPLLSLLTRSRTPAIFYCNEDEILLHCLAQRSWVYHVSLDPSKFKTYVCDKSLMTTEFEVEDDSPIMYYQMCIHSSQLSNILSKITVNDKLSIEKQDNTLVLMRKGKRKKKNILTLIENEEYEPYPFQLDTTPYIEFSLKDFKKELSGEIKGCEKCVFKIRKNNVELHAYGEIPFECVETGASLSQKVEDMMVVFNPSIFLSVIDNFKHDTSEHTFKIYLPIEQGSGFWVVSSNADFNRRNVYLLSQTFE